MSEFFTNVLFGVATVVAAVGAVLVVTRRNPIYSALFLIAVFAAVAVQFWLLQAEFLGFMQLLVYAGAIMVLYLFVIMLINPREDRLPDEGGLADRVVALGVSLLVLAFLCTAIQKSDRIASMSGAVSTPVAATPVFNSGGETATHGSTRAFGVELFSNHLLVFELASVLVMIAIIGAVHLSLRPRRRRPDGNSSASESAMLTTSHRTQSLSNSSTPGEETASV